MVISRRTGLQLAGALLGAGRVHEATVPVRRIVVIRPDHLGDVLLSSPALNLLRQAFPTAEITGMVGPWSAEVASRQPAFDRIAEVRFPGFTRQRSTSLLARYGSIAGLSRRLRREQFDLAIVLRPDFWWGAFLASAADVPRRLGYALPDVRPFLTHTLGPPPRRHAAIDALALAAAAARRWGKPLPGLLPASQAVPDATTLASTSAHVSGEPLSGFWQPLRHPLTFPLRAADRHAAAALLRTAGLPPGAPYALLHVGSGTEVKRWDRLHWVNLALALERDLALTPVICSGSAEHVDARAIAEASGARLPVPPPTVGALGALLRAAAVVVGADSGAMHLAVAVHSPSVTLFGPADPAIFGPWGNPAHHAIVASRMICAPCDVIEWPREELRFHPCVRRISVDRVLPAVRAVMAASRRDQDPTVCMI